MAAAPFITHAEAEEHLSSLTVERLLGGESTARRGRACRRVVTLIKGYAYPLPSEADAPDEWKGLALEWMMGALARDFPEYFRFDGAKRVVEVEHSIALTARTEPTDNKTHVGSVGVVDDWDYESGPCQC